MFVSLDIRSWCTVWPDHNTSRRNFHHWSFIYIGETDAVFDTSLRQSVVPPRYDIPTFHAMVGLKTVFTLICVVGHCVFVEFSENQR